MTHLLWRNCPYAGANSMTNVSLKHPSVFCCYLSIYLAFPCWSADSAQIRFREESRLDWTHFLSVRRQYRSHCPLRLHSPAKALAHDSKVVLFSTLPLSYRFRHFVDQRLVPSEARQADWLGWQGSDRVVFFRVVPSRWFYEISFRRNARLCVAGTSICSLRWAACFWSVCSWVLV